MARDFGHSAYAVVNRGRKAGKLYLRMCHDGLLQLPEDAETRLRIRKGAGLDRAPSVETWELAGAMLAAWPPVHAPLDLAPGSQADCGCWVGEEDGLLYEHLPADRDAAGTRFEGWLCPHNSPVYLGEPRPVSRIPTVDDGQRAGYALEAVTYAQETTTSTPAAGVREAPAAPLPGRDRGEAGAGGDGAAAPAAGPGGGAPVPVQPVPGVAPDQPTTQPAVTEGEIVLPAGWSMYPLPVNPHRITVALDRAKLEGPTADAKLGAVEPALDRWEAGLEQPTAAQLERLAAMANVPVGFFWLPDDAEPEIITAFLCGGRGRGGHIVTMRGEPAGRPRETLPGADDWWNV